MLHIINKSPFGHETLATCFRMAQGGDVLLIEDAVYAATPGTALESLIKAALERFNIHVLQPDLDARGVGAEIIEGVHAVDYGGFVDLVTRNATSQSWL